MRAIFISYRRNDSEGEAGRRFDDLVGHFGEDAVFMDVAAIQAGRDFRKAIDESVAGCGVLRAIIGTNWLDMKNRAGVRRLDDPSDFVRLETSAALRRDIPVIPVLVRSAKMPRPERLPEGLVDLAYRNGVELTHARWNSDLQVLIKALDRVLRGDAGGRGDKGAADAPRAPASRQRRATRLSLAAALIALLAIGGYGAYYLEGRRESARLQAERNEALHVVVRRLTGLLSERRDSLSRPRGSGYLASHRRGQAASPRERRRQRRPGEPSSVTRLWRPAVRRAGP